MDLSARMTDALLSEFVEYVEEISGDIGFKVSSRGWGYILEQRGIINKSQFDKVEAWINHCRKNGLLPVDFVAEEAARAFSNVEVPTEESHAGHVRRWVDHDPDGLRISQTMRKNLEDIAQIRWDDGFAGYDPSNLLIERFGLEYDFIRANRLTWIDNLITGSGKDLGSAAHPNHDLPYVQGYLKKVGPRKCEANSIVVIPEMGRKLCRETVLSHLGGDAEERFARKVAQARERIDAAMEDSGAGTHIRKAIKLLQKHDGT